MAGTASYVPSTRVTFARSTNPINRVMYDVRMLLPYYYWS